MNFSITSASASFACLHRSCCKDGFERRSIHLHRYEPLFVIEGLIRTCLVRTLDQLVPWACPWCNPHSASKFRWPADSISRCIRGIVRQLLLGHPVLFFAPKQSQSGEERCNAPSAAGHHPKQRRARRDCVGISASRMVLAKGCTEPLLALTPLGASGLAQSRSIRRRQYLLIRNHQGCGQ